MTVEQDVFRGSLRVQIAQARIALEKIEKTLNESGSVTFYDVRGLVLNASDICRLAGSLQTLRSVEGGGGTPR